MLEFQVVIDGHPKTYQLEDGEHHVGRAASNEIQVPVPRVSKQHAVIRIDGQRAFVRDLGSTNGTEVEGQAVGSEEVEVPPGGSIHISGVPVWRRASGDTNTTSLSAGLMPEDQIGAAKVFRRGDQINEDARVRIMDMLGSLFELLAREDDPAGIQRSACEFVGEWIDADRVFMLEDDGEATEVHVKEQWVREESARTKRRDVRLSSSIVKQVLHEQSAVLVSNALNDPRFQDQRSIIQLDLMSAMAAPLFDNQRVRGILYADCSRMSVHYDENDLQVLSSVANAVAVKLRALTLEKEMKTAGRIQRAMLPRRVSVPEGWQIDAHLVMCREVGGDLYHCLQRPNGRTLIVQGDVAGKGIPASLAMAATIVLIRSTNELGIDIAEMAPHLNDQLVESLAPEQFVTLFIGELDPTTGVLRYFNAGHEPPRLLRRGKDSVELLDSTGIPVGLLPGSEFGVGEVTLDPGDSLAIFTDGIPEATLTGDTFLGVEPVDNALLRHREGPLADVRGEILEAVENFLDKAHASDDITLLLLRRER